MDIQALTADIRARVERDFGRDAAPVLDKLAEVARADPHLDSPRIMRCLVFLARGDAKRLDHYTKLARVDYRDLIVAAEYETRPGTDPSQGIYDQVRDFNVPFSE